MFWFLLIYAVLWILSIWIIPIRLTLLHPILTLKYAAIDLFLCFKYKKWRVYKSGVFDCFDAGAAVVFGSGKTLSAVHRVRREYKKYNNKLIFDFQRGKWVTQKIHILTNLSFKNLPYEKLVNLGQIVQVCEKMVKYDAENDTHTCIIVLLDEAQNQLHCRSFKDNLSPLMLKSLTECRHFNMSIYYDAPRFNQVDALLRQCTNLNVKCHKIWRWQCQTVYDAADIENANNPSLVKSIKKDGFFIENDLFNEYDTKEIIDNLVKAKERGDFLSDQEVLALQCNQQTDVEAVNSKSSSLRKRLRKSS